VLARDVPASPTVAQAAVRQLVREPASATAAGAATALSAVWRVMAERTTRSWQEIPHFFLLREVNASRLIAWRESAKRQHGLNVTYTDLLVRAVAETLRAHPGANASWRDGAITRHAEINVGIAVASDEGLVVPVIHRADQRDLAEIAAEREALVKRAQAGKQRPDDLTGATFTISNLGMYGIDAFNAIVPGPQAAILAVGRIADRVVPLHGVPAVQPMMALSLSCDHRVIDGALGAKWLAAFVDLAEHPESLAL
jgi:pyruvate dehydrogenase E2 component (dihydrolipoamide acetyltransferase)